MKAKVEVKRNLKLNNLKSFSVITLMILAFASGKIVAADEFKLWHASGSSVDKELVHLNDDSKKEAIKMLEDKKHEDFVKKFSSEPFQMIEGIKELLVKKEKAIDDDSKVTDKVKAKEEARKELIDAMKKVDDKHFGSDKAKAFFISAIEEATKDINSAILLEKLFGTELAKQILALRGEKKEEVPPAPGVNPPVAGTTPTPTPGVRELTDDELKAQAQQICDIVKKNPTQIQQPPADPENAALKSEIEQLKNALNDTLNKVSEIGTPSPVNNQAQKREKGLEEILPGLLANALGNDDKNNDVAQPQQQQPFFPQQRNDRDNQDPNQFNQDLPQPQQQQAGMPFFPGMFGSTSSATQVPVRLDLPSASGREELKSAQSVIASLESRQPIASQLSFNAGIPELVMAKAKVSSQLKTAQAALNNAREQGSRLDEQLEELKDGGRAALAPNVKQKQAQLQQLVTTKKAQMDQQKQTLMMLAPEQRDQIMPMIQMLQQEVTTAEADLNNYNAQVEVAIESGNAQIKAMAKRRDQLNSAATKLESQIAGLKEDEASAQQLINTNLQMQQQQQVQQGGVPNINRIQGAGRSPVPSRIMSGAMSGNTNVMRGSLAGQSTAAKK